MSSDHFRRLARDFGKKRVALFLGPLFVITNIYPAIRNFFLKGPHPRLTNGTRNDLPKKEELRKTARICATLWKQKLNFRQHLPADDRQTFAMNPVHCLSAGWPVRFILTPQFDLYLNELLYIPVYSSVSSLVWRNDLENFLNGNGHIFHAFGGDGDAENLREVTDRMGHVEEKGVFGNYFAALFQKYSPLFIGFDPDDPIFRKLQNICTSQTADAKPWYVFFASHSGRTSNSDIDFRAMSADSDAGAPVPDANEMQDINTGFFIRLLQGIGKG